ncbi:MAG TPA: polysaccharide deacetylase family protein [Blastocatellia bacterium]|nr:polysaccharide deacetylase family protein [Blastocatellia bacterium]
MKAGLLNVMQAFGAFAPFRFANRSKALILTYHRFGELRDGVKTSAHAFARQLDYLSSHYRVVPLSALAELMRSGQEVPPRVAALTIDDGYLDAYEIAFPILRRYGVPATIFLVTGFVDRKGWLWTDKLRFLTLITRATRLEADLGGEKLRISLSGRASRLKAATALNSLLKALPDESKEDAINRIASSLRVSLPELPPHEYCSVSWDQAREMESFGMEIGSHTVSHPILTNVSEAVLQAELKESKARLEAELGHTVKLFCYPNGDYDARVRRAVEEAGYRCAVTVEPGLNDNLSDMLALKRVHTEQDMARFAQATSGFEQVKNRFRYAHAKIASF